MSFTSPTNKGFPTQFEAFKNRIPIHFERVAWVPKRTQLNNVKQDGNFDKYGGIPSIRKADLRDIKDVWSSLYFDCDRDDTLRNKNIAIFKTLPTNCKWLYCVPEPPSSEIDCTVSSSILTGDSHSASRVSHCLSFFFQVTDPTTDVTLQFWKNFTSRRDDDFQIIEFKYRECVPMQDILDHTVVVYSINEGLIQLHLNMIHISDELNRSNDEPTWLSDGMTYFPCQKVHWKKTIQYNPFADWSHLQTQWNCSSECLKQQSFDREAFGDDSSVCDCLGSYLFPDTKVPDHFYGFPLTNQDIEYRNNVYSFNHSIVPYMWGDCGVVNLCRDPNTQKLELFTDSC